MKTFPEHPEKLELCPKCVNNAGWEVRYHEYVHDSPWSGSSPMGVMEHLDWSCENCGYVVMTTTADAKVAVS